MPAYRCRPVPLSALILSVVLLQFSACATPSAPAATSVVVIPTARIESSETPPPALQPNTVSTDGTSTIPPRSQYRLDVNLDYPARQLQVEESLLYVNQSGQALPDLLLVVDAARYPGVFHLETIHWEAESPVYAYRLEGRLLRLEFARPLEPGESLQLELTFNLSLPYQSLPFGYTDRQLNLTDWYAIAPPFLPGEGWLAPPPHAFGEHQAYDLADYEVLIRTPEPGLVLAAPGDGHAGADGFRYHLEAARHFAWSASLEYLVLEQPLDGRTLRAFVFPEHRLAGESALQTMAQALPLYEALFGAYPRKTLAMIEADFYDGYEADGAFFLDQVYFNDPFRAPENLLTTLVAHETAHQWFYASLGSDQANQPWLDEAFCTYSELIFYQHAYPDSAGWWWQFRVQRLNPSGFVDSTIYDFENIQPYINAVYLRGASFLHDLRALLGDDLFFELLQDYARRGSGTFVSSAAFFNLLDEHTTLDYGYLLDLYFSPSASREPE